MWQQRRLARSATAELGWTDTPGGITVRALRIAASLLRSVGHPDVTGQIRLEDEAKAGVIGFDETVKGIDRRRHPVFIVCGAL